MTSYPSKYAWHGEFIPRDFPDGPIDVADSWRHINGRTNGLDLHLARFSQAAGSLPAGFVDAMLPLLAHGELFPRIALSQGLLLLDVRVAPPPRPTTSLTYVQAPDPRRQPEVKGPDFGAFRTYRSRFGVAGTDDVVIVDTQGALLETTTGALLSFDGDALVVPEGTKLPSVTLHQITTRAKQLGKRVISRPLTLEHATTHPLWFCNSLHGISPVDQLCTETTTTTPPAHPDVAEWQAWWWNQFR